jgi:hypothetical protein
MGLGRLKPQESHIALEANLLLHLTRCRRFCKAFIGISFVGGVWFCALVQIWSIGFCLLHFLEEKRRTLGFNDIKPIMFHYANKGT